MKKGTAIALTGDKELDRVLAAMPDRMQSQLIKVGMRAAAKPAVAFARKEVAKHDDGGSAQLKKSIGTVMRTYRNSGISVLVVGPRKGFKNADSGEEAHKYALAIEYGFQGRARDPFMKKTLAHMESRATRDFQKAMAKRIDLLKKKGKI